MILQYKEFKLTKSKTSRNKSTFVTGTGVFVDSDEGQLAHPLHSSSINAFRTKVHQQQVVVCTSYKYTCNEHPLFMYHIPDDLVFGQKCIN